MFIADPRNALIGTAIISLGVPVFFVRRWWIAEPARFDRWWSAQRARLGRWWNRRAR